VNIGEAAHIYGARKGFDLRFDENMTNADRRHLSNGIWLCSNCHTKIDKDEIEYTPNKLKQFKEIHYNRIKNGVYDKSHFEKIDIQNREIELLKQQIIDKERLFNSNGRIFNLELTALKIKAESLVVERDKIWQDYMSILENIDQIDNFGELYKLVFEDGNLKAALHLLEDGDLLKDETALVKKYLLKADIYKLQKSKEAAIYYKKAYQIRNTFEVASFYTRYLDDIKEFDTLVEIIYNVLKSENRPEKILILRGMLGRIYTKLNPELAINEYDSVLKMIDDKLNASEDYLFYKARFLNYLSIAYKNKGDIKQALSICENSLNSFLLSWVGDVESPIFFFELCSLHNTIAQLYESNLNFKEAERYYSIALKLCIKQVKDNGELKATILINYSQLYVNKAFLNYTKAISLIDEAQRAISILYEKQPLKYLELFIATICKKADYELLSTDGSVFLSDITKAKDIIDQYISLGFVDFKYLLAETESRLIMYYMFKGDIKLANYQIDKSISIYESLNFENEEFVQKHTILLIMKCNYLSDRDKKLELLNKAKLLLNPFLCNFNSLIIINIQIEEMITRLLNTKSP